ncbi:hypothetical protein GNP84_04525 [Aliivibrio fischeri]|uniref:hypothetical protein n=1 Tax=Aliivibrio fischeri TaxID=668 RepID=UPI0012D8A5E9|nr:hypothetical protein [Aliivibrio fischeri]MUK76171.1 hypothetical protein [Aliivibrio fischeri]
MNNLFIAISALLTVAIIFVPLIGAQKKSMAYHEELVKQAFIAKKLTDDDEKQDRLNLMISLSRSSVLALIFLFIGPFSAFRTGLSSIKQTGKNVANKVDDELLKMFMGSLYFSNPVIMTIAAVFCLIGFAIGVFILFSIISLMAITANNDQKLTNTNFVAPVRCVISKNINDACQILSKHMKQKHS